MALGDFGRDMLAEAARIAEQTVAREGTHLRWATVTDTDPLRIRYDGEPNPSIVTPQNTVAGLQVGDRVAVGKQHGQATIIGRAGGTRSEYRIETGEVTVNLSNSNSGSTVFTFPAGAFTDTPVLAGGIRSNTAQYTIAGCQAASPTEGHIYVRRVDGTSQTASLTVGWVAIRS